MLDIAVAHKFFHHSKILCRRQVQLPNCTKGFVISMLVPDCCSHCYCTAATLTDHPDFTPFKPSQYKHGCRISRLYAQ